MMTALQEQTPSYCNRAKKSKADASTAIREDCRREFLCMQQPHNPPGIQLGSRQGNPVVTVLRSRQIFCSCRPRQWNIHAFSTDGQLTSGVYTSGVYTCMYIHEH